MKINIKQKDKAVTINVDFYCGFAGIYIYEFIHHMDRPSSAGLVAEAIQRQFEDHIEEIRRQAYEEGWKYKQQRKKKRTWFGTCFNRIKMV